MMFLSCKDPGSVLACEPTRQPVLAKCRSISSDAVAPDRQAKLRIFTSKELETATGGFSKENFLGKGSYGFVYKGTLKDGKVVAVKRLECSEDKSTFENELKILLTLHSHWFVNLVGICKESDTHKKFLVVDYMANGTLDDLLHRGQEPLSWTMRVHLALQAATAILALHSSSPVVIHRDISTPTIFVDGKWNAKLGNFGLAVRGHIDTVRQRPVPPPGTFGSLDPDYEIISRLSSKIDVFSFGVVLLEIISGRKACDMDYKTGNIIGWALPLIKQGKAYAIYDPRLTVVPQVDKLLRHMAEIAARCVRPSSSRRPSMPSVVGALAELSKISPLPISNDLGSLRKKYTATPGPKVVDSVELGAYHSWKCREPCISASIGTVAVSEKAADSTSEQLLAKFSHAGKSGFYRTSDQSRDILLKRTRKHDDAELFRKSASGLLLSDWEVLDLSMRDKQDPSCGKGQIPVFEITTSRGSSCEDVVALFPRKDGSRGLPGLKIYGGISTCIANQALRLSRRVRARSVTTARRSLMKTRANFEKEEALLPW